MHTATGDALLMGATGLVGAAALPLLSQRFATVWTPGRRPPPHSPANSAHIETDFTNLSALDDAIPNAPAVLCIAFGTTIKQAGSQAWFKIIDKDYPLALARWALQKGTRRICLISAVGASAHSRVFYNRIKGELEQELKALPLQSLHILRPSLLLGHHPHRPLETLGQTIMGPLAPLFPAKIRPIRASQLAEKMVACAIDNSAEGVQILEGRVLFETAPS